MSWTLSEVSATNKKPQKRCLKKRTHLLLLSLVWKRCLRRSEYNKLLIQKQSPRFHVAQKKMQEDSTKNSGVCLWLQPLRAKVFPSVTTNKLRLFRWLERRISGLQLYYV